MCKWIAFYSKCACLYICMWYTLVGYIHDANCLYYLHKSGHTSWCSICHTALPSVPIYEYIWDNRDNTRSIYACMCITSLSLIFFITSAGHMHSELSASICFLAHNRMSVMSLCNHDLSVIVVIVVVVCEHSSWPHAWPNKIHTLHAHAAISCIVAHQKLYHSDLYLLYSSHICMFILMSIVHEVINIATSNLTETCI